MSKYFDGNKLSGYEDSPITYVYGSNLEECHKIITDLETKLAEKDERINWLVEAEFNRKWAKKYVEMRRKEDPMLCLPDSDEVYERYFQQQELIDNLKQQLAAKNKAIEKLDKRIEKQVDNGYKIIQNCKEIQRQAIIEQLEKVKELVEEKGAISSPFGNLKIQASDVSVIIDNQIKAIKEGK